MNNTVQKLIKALSVIALTGASNITNAQTDPTLNWGQAGPVYTAGRARNIVVDKADPSGNTLYAGSASSGVFKTTNGGVLWAPIDDQGEVRNISYMAQDANNVIWVATGEGFLRYGQKLKAQVGTGLYKLTGNSLGAPFADASVTGTVINRIACNPNDASKIVLATNKGILISTTGGQSFNAAPGVTVDIDRWFGMDVKFDNNGILYCSIGNERGAPFQAVDSKVYKSTDASLSNFIEITPSSPELPPTVRKGRIELGIAPSNNQVIYASVANKNVSTASANSAASASLNAVYVSYNAGTTWNLLLQGSSQMDPLSNGGTIASGDYAHVVLVNPVNPNQVFIGGYFLSLFTRTGGSDAAPTGIWGTLGSPYALNTPAYLHENIHDIKIVGNDPATAKIYVVTDAGIFRTSDLLNPIFPSFQPFYAGFVTGQFNSVSIETLPASSNAGDPDNNAGQAVLANDGFIGGTGGNGLTYFSGKYPNVSQEINYLSGEIYNAEFSKLLPKAAFFTVGSSGAVLRTSDVRSSQPVGIPVNTYTGALSLTTPNSGAFGSVAFSNVTGTPFRLWENYGQVANTPDSLVFYNDTLRVLTSLDNLNDLLTRTTFTFSAGRPNKFALIDSVAIRTSTVAVPFATPEILTVPFTAADKKNIYVKLSNYTVPSGQTLTIPAVSGTVGPVSAAGVTLNASTLLDEISVTFTSPPFANKSTTVVADPSIYYKVYATVFYKYAVNDTITFVDNSISTRPIRITHKLTTPLRWSKNSLNGPKPYSGETNPPQKIPAPYSARLAMVYSDSRITGGATNYAIVVSKAPLNLNDPLNLVRVSQSGALTTDANGVPTNSVITFSGKPVILEWSKNGRELYFATDDNKLYRVSYINTIMDLSSSSYNGKLYNDIFKYGTNSPVTSPPVINPASPFRTTLLWDFGKPITSISIASNDTNMVVTLDDDSPAGSRVMTNTRSIRTSNSTNANFVSKDGNASKFPVTKTYCSLIEHDNTKLVFVGTENGLFCTTDINAASPTWKSVNDFAVASGTITNHLPKVQIFDIKQQTMPKDICYNSRMIYVATNGRGVWKNGTFYQSSTVSVDELDRPKAENNLSLFPNPTNGGVTASFSVNGEETISLQVMDISGRLVKSEQPAKVFAGQTQYSFNTSDLSGGVYIVNISGTSGIKRVAKLIVTK